MPRQKLKKKENGKEKVKLTAAGVPRKKPGPKPGSTRVPKKKIVGHEMPARSKKAMEAEFAKLSKNYDAFSEHVASLTYDTNAEAGLKAMKLIKPLVDTIKSFKKTIRSTRESLKPVYEASQAA